MKIYWLLALLIFVSCHHRREQIIAEIETQKRNEKVISIIETEVARANRQMADELEEYFLREYYPIVDVRQSVEKHFELIMEIHENIEERVINENINVTDWNDFQYFVESRFDSIYILFDNFLSNYGIEPVGLRENEIKLREMMIRDILDECLSNLKSFDPNSKDLDYYIITNWKLDLTLLNYTLLKELQSYYTGSRVRSSSYFPIVNAKKCQIEEGEKFEAEVSLGTYSNDVDSSDITFILNNDTIPFRDNGITPISILSSKIGENILHMTCQIRNRYTGQALEYSTTFQYEVLPK